MVAVVREIGPATRRVAKNIKHQLIDQDINQQDLAKRLGVYDSWVSRRLSAMSPITMDDLERFADALGVDPSVLLGSTRGFIRLAHRLRDHNASAAMIPNRYAQVTPVAA